MSEEQQTWYLARDGAIVLQGSRADLAKAARGGFLRGDEACWTEGMAGWESVGDSARAAWIREASKVHEEMTGTLLQFRAPEGTDELEIPNEPAWAQQAPGPDQASPKPTANPQPERRRSNRGRRSTDKPKRGGLGLLVGLVMGAGLALGAVYLISKPEPTEGLPKPSAPASPTAQTAEQPAPPTPAEPVPDAGPTTKVPADTAPAATKKPAPSPKKVAPVAQQKAKPAQARPEPSAPARRVVNIPEDEDTKTAQAALNKVEKSEQSPVRSADRQAELKRSLATRQAKFVSCLKSAKIAKPGLRGTVTFLISVSANGQVTGVRSRSGRPGPEYSAACLLGELQSLNFPKGEATQVRIKATVP